MKIRKRKDLCYLRTHRRIWGLTQRELASLVGCVSETQISRIEHGKRTPTVKVALACQVIFGIPPKVMFSHVQTLVEERVMRHIYGLHLALSHTTDPSGLRKRELCAVALKRAVSKSGHLEGI